MTGYHVYLTYGRYVYPSPKIVVHENKSINIRTYNMTIKVKEALNSQYVHEVQVSPSSQG